VETLKSFYNIMRKHQKKAIDAISVSIKGQVILPTACGKTWVQVYAILSSLMGVETGVAVIAAHRLLLCEQLLKEVLKRAFKSNLKFDILTVASDGVDEEDVARINEGCQDLLKHCNVSRSTTMEEIKQAVAKAKGLGRHLLIVSTYQSIARLSGISVDIACMDEAHVITEDDKYQNVKSILGQLKRVFFFTATPVHGCNGRGMDDVSFYGQELVKVSPRAAIDSGDILPPVIHRIELIKGKPTEHSVIQTAFKAHREKVLEFSKGKVGPKLLVSVAGVLNMVALIKSPRFNTWAMKSGIHVIAFSSSMGYYANGLDVTRKEALDRLVDLKDDESAIILHYDILTEGIDLPNITGILPLRELCKVKFLQTAGRAARLQLEDRSLVYNNASVRTTIDEEGRIVLSGLLLKPVFWIIQSPLLNEQAHITNAQLVEIIREAYEVTPEFRHQPQVSTTKDVEEAETVLAPEIKTPAEKRHAEYTHEYEALLFSQLSDELKAQIIEGHLTLLENENSVIALPDLSKDTVDEIQNQIPQGNTQSPLPEASPVGTPKSPSDNVGFWDDSFDKDMGL